MSALFLTRVDYHSCLCVFCVGPLCGPPLRWWVLCGALPSVWVPCVGPLCGSSLCGSPEWVPCVLLSTLTAYLACRREAAKRAPKAVGEEGGEERGEVVVEEEEGEEEEGEEEEEEDEDEVVEVVEDSEDDDDMED